MNAKFEKLHRVVLWLSFLAECALCVPEGERGLLLWLLAAAASTVLFRALPESRLKPRRPSALTMTAAVLYGVYLAVSFFDRWSQTAAVQALTARLGVDLGTVMTVVSILALAASTPFLLWLGGHLGDAAEKLEDRVGGGFAVGVLFALEAVLLIYVLQTSCMQDLIPQKAWYFVPAKISATAPMHTASPPSRARTEPSFTFGRFAFSMYSALFPRASPTGQSSSTFQSVSSGRKV